MAPSLGLGLWVGRRRSSQYWTQQKINDSCLFFASDNTSILNKVVATQLPNQVTGAVDYLTVTGVGLNARYRTPDNATYRTAESGYVFWKSDANESICDGNRLIAYDFPRILVKYLNVAPYTILWIAILKPGVTVTDGMRDAFDLSVWWDNTLSFHGSTKLNRGTGQAAWSPEGSALPTGLTLTLISGGVKYDWTDNSGGTAQTEVWCRSDSGAYTTATYTINAGTVTKSETITPVDLRYCKIRSKTGGLYSAFTAEQSIAMLGVELMPAVSVWAASDKAFWNAIADANWTGDGTKLMSDGNNGRLYRTGFYSIGDTFLISTTVNLTSGSVIKPSDYYAPNGSITVSGTYTYIFTYEGTAALNIRSDSFLGNITALSIKKILMP